MTVRLFERRETAEWIAAPPARPASEPDPGYRALPGLIALRDRLVEALSLRAPRRRGEPDVFFFDHRRQAEFESARPETPAEPANDLAAAIALELPELYASVEARRVARSVNGLQESAASMAPKCPAARDLAELLAMPEDEVVLVLYPARRAGFRVAVRGIADLGQFHILLADAVTGDPASGLVAGAPMPARLVAACRGAACEPPAGVPMIAEARFQLYLPGALRTDGSLPGGFAGCEHWLWPASPLAGLPRVDRERVVLIGPRAFDATWEVARRFPDLRAELRLIETLSPFRVAERLTRLAGGALAPRQWVALAAAA
jgi:hypothetical protein